MEHGCILTSASGLNGAVPLGKVLLSAKAVSRSALQLGFGRGHSEVLKLGSPRGTPEPEMLYVLGCERGYRTR